MFEVLTWWLALTALGVIAWPALFHLLPGLPDRGYTAARATGLLVTGYLVWLLGTLHVLPNTRGGHVVLLAVLALGSAVLAARRWPELRAFWRENRALLVVGEAVFLVALATWAFIRAHNPEIAATEKPMDFAFLNAIHRSAYFPPPDPWLAGHPISYYYFGYLLADVVIQLTGVATAVGFNLALAMLAALAALAAFGLGYNVWRARAGTSARSAVAVGLTTAFLLLGIGNLQGALDVARANNLGDPCFWKNVGVNNAFRPYASANRLPVLGLPAPDETWWWWHSTRVINTLQFETGPDCRVTNVVDSRDYTITEFPFFSFLLGDLHPHVLALPFTLLALALALDVALHARPALLAWPRRAPLRFGFAALTLGALGFLNSWDFPTYTLVYLGAGALQVYWARHAWGWPETLNVIGFALALGLSALVLYAPFFLGFQSQAGGLLPWRGPATQPQHFLIIWGPLLFLAASLLVAQYLRRDPHPWSLGPVLLAAAAALAPLVLWLVADAVAIRFADPPSFPPIDGPVRFLYIWPLVVLFGAAVLALLRGALAPRPADPAEVQPGPPARGARAHAFILLLLAVACFLVLFTELFYIKDVFGNRMNTVFKFYYQAWTLFAAAAAYGVYFMAAQLRPNLELRRTIDESSPRPRNRSFVGRNASLAWGVPWALVAAGLLLAAFVYPVFAVDNKTDHFGGEATLDGLAFTRVANPGEAAAIDWLARNARGQPVVAEATGGQYSEFGRVSERTGLPTILGWAGHEDQWRGSNKLYLGRDREIDILYGADPAAAAQVINRYNVGYVYYGTLERAKYPTPSFDRMPQLLEIAFRNEAATIYRVKPDLVAREPR